MIRHFDVLIRLQYHGSGSWQIWHLCFSLHEGATFFSFCRMDVINGKHIGRYLDRRVVCPVHLIIEIVGGRGVWLMYGFALLDLPMISCHRCGNRPRFLLLFLGRFRLKKHRKNNQ